MLHATYFRGKPMSQFQEKVFAACAKKEALFDESLGRYALRSMLAGAYLTMSTAVGIIGADVIATGIPALYLCHRTGLRSHIQWRVGYFKHDVPDQWCLLW